MRERAGDQAGPTRTRLAGPTLNATEQEAMDHLLAFMRLVQAEWGLRANDVEFVLHVHGLQTFVVQHMLQRLAPDRWSKWFDEAKMQSQRSVVEGDVAAERAQLLEAEWSRWKTDNVHLSSEQFESAMSFRSFLARAATEGVPMTTATDAGRALLRADLVRHNGKEHDEATCPFAGRLAAIEQQARSAAEAFTAGPWRSLVKTLLDAADSYAEEGGVLEEWSAEQIVKEARAAVAEGAADG